MLLKHIVAAVAEVVIVGNGFTVTNTVWPLPTQLPVLEVGVTVYVTTWAPATESVSVLLNVLVD